MLRSPIPSATSARTIADRGIAASIVPIHRESTTLPVLVGRGLGPGPIQPVTQDFRGRQHGRAIGHEEQTVMVAAEVLDTHRQPKAADREFHEAQKSQMSPDRPRPFAIEQESKGRDHGKGPCPGPRADTHGHEVRVAASIAAPVSASPAWSQGT